VIPAGQTAAEFCNDDVGGVVDEDPPNDVDDVDDDVDAEDDDDEVGGVAEQQDAPADVLPRSGA
jgi:hypothetical protein